MKRILDDYRLDNSLRYEAHLLHYLPEGEDEMILGGIMGAAVLCALLADTDEGDARGITVDGEVQRNDLFDRYEREVRRDNGGLFLTEVVALSNAYMELYHRWREQLDSPTAIKQFPNFVRHILRTE